MATSRARSTPALRALPPTLDLPEAALLDVVTAMAEASRRYDVAEAACRVLLELDGVRAVAVAQRDGRSAVVVGSAGYGCDSMAAGAALPLDNGLPIAQAIRSGQIVTQGAGPGWVAVPFGSGPGRGALLLSLTIAPSDAPEQHARLQRLARTLHAALTRAAGHDRAVSDLACVVAGLSWSDHRADRDIAIRQTAHAGDLGGDVALSLPAADGARWLVAADVCGSGLAAATGAAAVRTAIRALAPLAQGPAHLLQLLDAALRPEAPEGGFVTAVVAYVAGRTVRVASAGHPAPVLLTATGAEEIAVEAGQPLALEGTDGLALPAEARVTLTDDAVVVLYSDGLLDRRGPGASDLDVVALLSSVGPGAPDAVANRIVAAADAAGPATDDSTVLVSRV